MLFAGQNQTLTLTYSDSDFAHTHTNFDLFRNILSGEHFTLLFNAENIYSTTPTDFTLNSLVFKMADYSDGGDEVCSICGKVPCSCNQTSILTPKGHQKHGIKFAVNPVSDKAEISVVLPNNERIVETKIAIYDMTGNVVWASTASTGSATTWNLTNSAGRFVANGTYLVIAEVKDQNGRIHRYSARLGVKR